MAVINEKQAQIIDFSFEMKEFSDHLSLRETYLQTRFYAVKLLNQVAAGLAELTEEDKRSIRVYNRYCKVAGTEPINGDFY